MAQVKVQKRACATPNGQECFLGILRRIWEKIWENFFFDFKNFFGEKKTREILSFFSRKKRSTFEIKSKSTATHDFSRCFYLLRQVLQVSETPQNFPGFFPCGTFRLEFFKMARARIWVKLSFFHKNAYFTNSTLRVATSLLFSHIVVVTSTTHWWNMSPFALCNAEIFYLEKNLFFCSHNYEAKKKYFSKFHNLFLWQFFFTIPFGLNWKWSK